METNSAKLNAEKLRSVYGRGLYDGQQRLIERMNNSVFLAKERGLTSVARKVFDATPIDEPWEIARIIAELRRLGCQAEYRIVHGCLGSLVNDGLVREPEPGSYVRLAKRPKLVEKPQPVIAAPAPQATPAVAELAAPRTEKEVDPIQRMSALADQLRELAATVEEVALEFAEKVESIKADSAKLRQLQELLKSI